MPELEDLDNPNQVQKPSGILGPNKMIFISVAVGVLLLIYTIVLFIVPRTEYLNSKKNTRTEKPNVALIVLYFIMQFLFILTIVPLVQLILTGCDEDGSGYYRSWGCLFNTILLSVCGSLVFVVWIVNLILSFVYTYNAGNCYSPDTIRNYINQSQNTNLMVYCYGYYTQYRYRYYSTPLTFKVNLSNPSNIQFDDFDYPNNYAYQINYNDIKDDGAEEISQKCINELNTYYNKIGKTPKKIYTGIYPDFNEIYYVSKDRKLRGKYSQVSRIFASIFGVATVYDHYLKSIDSYSVNITRMINCTDIDQKSTGSSNFFAQGVEPNLSFYYQYLYFKYK